MMIVVNVQYSLINCEMYNIWRLVLNNGFWNTRPRNTGGQNGDRKLTWEFKLVKIKFHHIIDHITTLEFLNSFALYLKKKCSKYR